MFHHLFVVKTARCDKQESTIIGPAEHTLFTHNIYNVLEINIQNYNIVLSHCYAGNITLEPMKQPHSTLSEMYKIIKCTNHNKPELKECCKPKLTEQLLVTPFDTEWTHHRTTPINNISQSFTFKHTNGLRGRLQGTSHQSI